MVKIEPQLYPKTEPKVGCGRSWDAPGIQLLGAPLVVGSDDYATVSDFYEYVAAIGGRIKSQSFTVRLSERAMESFTLTHRFGLVPSLVYITCGRNGDTLSLGDEAWDETTISLRTSADDHGITICVVAVL